MNIALLGFGVVGSGVYEWCRSREDLHVCRVLIRSDKPEIAGIATRDFDDILHDPNIDVVAEVMGGLHPAYEYVTAALKAGKHVVTANKALVAAYYRELTALADVCGKARFAPRRWAAVFRGWSIWPAARSWTISAVWAAL